MTTPGAHIAYRPDIDGLRAVAVLPVVLYHAGVQAFSGGYVGVDVFFVISGFLIAGIIAREISQDRFSLVHFYERRARRILPALFVVIATTLVAASIVSWPGDFADIGESAIATLVFGSNLYFWQTTDYFATAAEYRPLLHTWSLAVEEQFYIVFPLLLMLVARRARGTRVALILAILVASVVACFIAAERDPAAAFYLAPMRTWELMLGVVLALNIVPAWPDRFLREAAAAAGLLLIAFSVFAFERMTSLIPLAMAVPTTGAALIIQAGRGEGRPTAVARLLSAKPLVFVGLVSYSLYLWHWPILAFARSWLESTHLAPAWAAGCILGSLAIAALSWRYVERPFRTPGSMTRGFVFRFAAAGATVLAGIAVAVVVANGFPGRIPGEAFDALAGAKDMEENRHRCMGRKADGDYCVIGAGDTAPSAVLIGDSHAAALMSAVGVALQSQARSAFLASYSACPPLAGIRQIGDDGRAGCDAFVDSMLEFIAARRESIDLVILAARWPVYVTGQPAPGEPESRFRMAAIDGEGDLDNPELVALGLTTLVRRLGDDGVRVVILGAVPEIGWHVPRTIARTRKLGIEPPPPPTLATFARRQARAEQILREVARSNRVTYLPLAPLLCDPVCSVLDRSKPLYVDDDHLSAWGAREVLGPRLAIEWSEPLISQSF